MKVSAIRSSTRHQPRIAYSGVQLARITAHVPTKAGSAAMLALASSWWCSRTIHRKISNPLSRVMPLPNSSLPLRNQLPGHVV
eukprot:3416221-Rhodomonas_salina.4